MIQSGSQILTSFALRLFKTKYKFNSKGIEAVSCMGFVQDMSLMPEFSMTLFSEKQLRCVHQVPHEERIIHMDASGTFVNVSKKTGFVYSRILNYIMLMKDDRIKNNTLAVAEMVNETRQTSETGPFSGFFCLRYRVHMMFFR